MAIIHNAYNCNPDNLYSLCKILYNGVHTRIYIHTFSYYYLNILHIHKMHSFYNYCTAYYNVPYRHIANTYFFCDFALS